MGRSQDEVIPLSYIDDVNTFISKVTKRSTWHQHLDKAAAEMELTWDVQKDWQGKRGKHLVVFLEDEKRHWKERTRKARAA